MPRTARKKSQSRIYHIILRGINRQSIFEDDEDRKKLLQTLLQYKERCGYSLYAYCFMGNHFHLLLKVGVDPLEQVMRRIAGSYVYWYNRKYERIGNLFQDRFKSEPIENDSYFLTVLRYIHRNPVKAGITKAVEAYKWSSYKEYIEGKGIIDREYVLAIFNENIIEALKAFIKFTNELNDDMCLEIEEGKRKLADDTLREVIQKMFKIQAMMIQNEPREEMEKILKRILELEGVSTRQLSRVTGISVNIIWRL